MYYFLGVLSLILKNYYFLTFLHWFGNYETKNLYKLFSLYLWIQTTKDMERAGFEPEPPGSKSGMLPLHQGVYSVPLRFKHSMHTSLKKKIHFACIYVVHCWSISNVEIIIMSWIKKQYQLKQFKLCQLECC